MDKIDSKILGMLMDDGRASLRDLGEAVHLSPNAVAGRVKRLTDAGVLRGYRAQVDMAALGFRVEAMVSVKMQAGTSAEHFESMLQTIPGIVQATLTTGDFDYLLRLACRDQDDFVRIMEALRERGRVQSSESRIICRERSFPLDIPA